MMRVPFECLNIVLSRILCYRALVEVNAHSLLLSHTRRACIVQSLSGVWTVINFTDCRLIQWQLALISNVFTSSVYLLVPALMRNVEVREMFL